MNEVFDDNGNLVDERYDKRVVRFLDEFEWYIEALKNQRKTELRIKQPKPQKINWYPVSI